MTTGADLKAYRRERQWRQTELAEHLGTSQPVISEIERGLRPVPDEFAAALGFPQSADGSADPVDTEGLTTAIREGDDSAPGDVPPRPIKPGRDVVVLHAQRDLADLEARLLKLIVGEDIAIAVADPGETTIRHEAAHLPGVADVVAYGNPMDGEIIRSNAVPMAKAWVSLAKEKPRVRQFLETLTAGGAWRNVFAATAPVIIAILLNHGLLPAIPGLSFAPDGGYDAARDDGGGAAAGAGAGWSETAAGSVG